MGRLFPGWAASLAGRIIAGRSWLFLSKEKGVALFGNTLPGKHSLRTTANAAFYAGKVAGARFFIKNILPEVDAAAKAIKSEDLSVVDIVTESFA